MPIPPTGRVMGHEGTGVVEVLGKGVATDTLAEPIEEGARVFYSATLPCHYRHLCLRGDINWCANRAYPTAGVYPYFTGTFTDLPTFLPCIPSTGYLTSFSTVSSAPSTAPLARLPPA